MVGKLEMFREFGRGDEIGESTRTSEQGSQCEYNGFDTVIHTARSCSCRDPFYSSVIALVFKKHTTCSTRSIIVSRRFSISSIQLYYE